MKLKKYSFNRRLRKISYFAWGITIICGIVGGLGILGNSNQSVNTWIIENQTNTTDPVGPIGIVDPKNLSIPYSAIFFDNFVVILIIPVGFILVTFMITTFARNKLLKKEIVNLYRSTGIKSTKSTNGTVKIGDDSQLQILGDKNGLFLLKKENKILAYANGEELYWKINLMRYLEEKNN